MRAIRTKYAVFSGVFAIVAAACGTEQTNGASRKEPEPTRADAGPSGAAAATMVSGFVLQLGDDVLPGPRERITAHLTKVRPDIKVITDPSLLLAPADAATIILAIGRTTTSSAIIPDRDVASLNDEGYVLRRSSTGVFAARGRADASAKDRFGIAHRNTAYAAYALLEEIGFGFLHPLAPTLPAAITLAELKLDRREEPRWPIRGMQLHTMHPLELTDLLQGWGDGDAGGPNDQAGFEAMLPEWDRFLEWMLANGQNRVHWVLLEAGSWSDFAQSETRRQRIERLVKRAHDFGIAAGADVPIALQQQHTFRLITKTGELSDELNQLRSRVDWLMSTGFDYLATENGTTEFSHGSAERMLEWMNALAIHLDEKHGHKPSYVKLHCSTKQTAEGYPDPITGQPINFNFLPHFADKRLGVMPHTVQDYGLDDPAPTYGNIDFGYMHNFLKHEVGLREVVWHPETAYWVSFDVDVPLFLPVYAERRVHDLRLLAEDEAHGRMGLGANAGKKMDGQQTFSSGWEWGYWLNDVVTARAAWNPHDASSDPSTPDDSAALRVILDHALRPLGEAVATDVRDLILETAKAEHDLFILGKVGGKPPLQSIEKMNAQAYLQGVEAWDDISDLSKQAPAGLPLAVALTQPDKLGLVEMRTPILSGPHYTGQVEPLLAATEATLNALLLKWDALAASKETSIPAGARDLFDDLHDAMKMTALRARQVHGLYDYVDKRNEPIATARMARLNAARAALDEAALVVKEREPRYRVPAKRIAGWRNGPTAYEFGYLWTVHSLHYWWRDEGKAVDAPRAPCYLNVINAVDIGLGEGTAYDATKVLQNVFSTPNIGGSMTECIDTPKTEPIYPQFNLRSRP